MLGMGDSYICLLLPGVGHDINGDGIALQRFRFLDERDAAGRRLSGCAYLRVLHKYEFIVMK